MSDCVWVCVYVGGVVDVVECVSVVCWCHVCIRLLF